MEIWPAVIFLLFAVFLPNAGINFRTVFRKRKQEMNRRIYVLRCMVEICRFSGILDLVQLKKLFLL